MSLTTRIPIDRPEAINTGFTSPSTSFMLDAFGEPRANLTDECEKVTNAKLAKRMLKSNVGPFEITGHVWLVIQLKKVFAEVKEHRPDLYAALGTAGALCCRKMRGSDRPSGHSWGLAIDIKISGILDSVGDGKCLQGLRDLYYFMHRHGFYWGAEFKGPREDAMHFELSKEQLEKMIAEGNFYGVGE